MSEQLTFARLSYHNLLRCEDIFHPLDAWTPTDWGCALAGETGELCNKLKKMRRGEPIGQDELAEELADIVIYADLLAQRLEIDLGAAVVRKFNSVSDKYNSNVKL